MQALNATDAINHKQSIDLKPIQNSTHAKYALLSVSDKTGIVELAKQLSSLGYTILSTGGTANLLKPHADINLLEVAEHIQYPEILDGRVKTLNPKIHGGILAQRQNPEHMQTLTEHNIQAIDVVVVNLYPFSQTIAQSNVTLADAIEQIDIGGPTMVRASAKNHQDVYSVVNPNDYARLIEVLTGLANQSLTADFAQQFRFELACAAFAHTASYDAMIAAYLQNINNLNINKNNENINKNNFAETLQLEFTKVQDLRYGENPHQQAAFYKISNLNNNKLNNLNNVKESTNFADYELLQGKELSYNNLADADAAWQTVKSFGSAKAACVIVKHANPCGVALANNALAAYEKALMTDKTSAFGGILAFNQTLDEVAVQSIMQQFLEVLIAPDYTEKALEILKNKPNVRVLKINLPEILNNPNNNINNASNIEPHFEIKTLDGGILYQTVDQKQITLADLQVVSAKQPTTEQLNDLLFAFKVAKSVKSNAIVFCDKEMTLGIGAGQMSRLDSAKIATIKADHAGLNLQGSVVASDAFFPFTDTLDVVADAGASCIIQPGGSIKDPEVIARANERGLVMVFTGVRHFKH